jgi:RNA polymerase sigma-70 factor (ECF subfamily)
METSRTGAALLARAHPPAFDDVYEAEFDFVYRVVSRLWGGSDVEDLVQEVFVVVHRRLPEFRGEAQLSTWLFRIAYRVIGAHVRRERLRRGLQTLFGQWAEGPERADPDAAHERARRVRRALDAMSYGHRGALVLFEIEGWSCAEIADALDVPVGTVYRRLHEARKTFARVFEPSEEP